MAVEHYTLADLENAVKHAIAGTPNSKAPASQIVNRALKYLVKSHPWKWRIRNMSLDISATPIDAMERSSDVVTIDQVGHGYSVGSAFAVTGAVGSSFNGNYVVASVPNSDQFTFSQAGDDEVATTAGLTVPGFIRLPADFDSLIKAVAISGGSTKMTPCSITEIWEMRQCGASSLGTIWYAVGWQSQSTASDLPVPVLEIYPAITSQAKGLIAGSYMRVPPSLVDSSDVPDIPDSYHGLLMTLCRAFAVSNEEDRLGVDWEMYGAMAKPLIADDGASQGIPIGRMRSTLKRGYGRGPFYGNRISAT